MSWTMRYTSHLGYEPPHRRMQFAKTLATTDPVAHIHHAKKVGMSGVLYPWALERPSEEVIRVKIALSETGLKCSTIVCMSFPLLTTAIWTDRSQESRKILSGEISRSSEMAASLGSAVLAVLIGRDVKRDAESQRDDVAANLKDMARLATQRGLTLGIEPMVVLPNMLIRHMREAVDLLQRTDEPN